MAGNVYLMYHELEQVGRPLCVETPGYARYAVSAEAFRAQMRAIQLAGLRGISVGDALDRPQRDAVVLTFDDGCESDWTVAAPVLREHGFSATFYVTSGFIDTPGHLSTEHLRSLADAGFEVGCHSATHRFLTHATDEELRVEIMDARDRIPPDDGSCGVPLLVSGRTMESACPGGGPGRRLQLDGDEPDRCEYVLDVPLSTGAKSDSQRARSSSLQQALPR